MLNVIEFLVSIPALVTFEDYDLLGQEVATLVCGVKQLSEYNVHFDAPVFNGGIHIYRLKAGKFSANKKMFLIR